MVGFNVFCELGSNFVEVFDVVMKVIEKVKEDFEFIGISLFVMDDIVKSVILLLSDLLNVGFLGVLFLVIVLYLFLC